MSSPTKRSLDYMRGQGFDVQVVERWNAFARCRQDLFGFIDIVCICPKRGIVGVQSTTCSNMKARINKIESDEVVGRARKWLAAGGRIIVHGWRKSIRKDGVRKGSYVVKVHEIFSL